MASSVDTYLKWTARKKALLWIVVCAVVVAVYVFFGYLPQTEKLEALQADYDRLGTELRENQTIDENLERVREELERLDAKLEEALKKLPETEEIPKLLETVSDLGKDSGLEFLLFKPAPPEPQTFYAEVPLELQMLGRYHDLAAFFDKVGRLPRIVTIQDIDFGNPKAEHGGTTLKVSCRAVTFQYIEPSEAAQANTTEEKSGKEGKKSGKGDKKSRKGGKK
jgi:type IV pilus assembly protein PilO